MFSLKNFTQTIKTGGSVYNKVIKYSILLIILMLFSSCTKDQSNVIETSDTIIESYTKTALVYPKETSIDNITVSLSETSMNTSNTIEINSILDYDKIILETDFNGDDNNEMIFYNSDEDFLTLEINKHHFIIPIVESIFYFSTNEKNTTQDAFAYYTGNTGFFRLEIFYPGGFVDEDWTGWHDITAHYDYRRISYSIFNATADDLHFNQALHDINGFLTEHYNAENIKEYRLFNINESEELRELQVNNNHLYFVFIEPNEVYIMNEKFMLKSFIPDSISLYSRKRLYAYEQDENDKNEYEYLLKLQRDDAGVYDVQYIYLGTADENLISPYNFYDDVIDDTKLDEQEWDLANKNLN
jgi:hypothetical protein